VLLARVHVLDAIPLVLELATVLAKRPVRTAGLALILLLGHRERKGYPEGAPQMVHDSARVFRVFDGELFFRLRLDVEADLVDSPDHQEFMKQFDSSYETIEETNCLIGILVSGAVDTGVRLNASWERHEHTAVEVPSVAALRAMI